MTKEKLKVAEMWLVIEEGLHDNLQLYNETLRETNQDLSNELNRRAYQSILLMRTLEQAKDTNIELGDKIWDGNRRIKALNILLLNGQEQIKNKDDFIKELADHIRILNQNLREIDRAD